MASPYRDLCVELLVLAEESPSYRVQVREAVSLIDRARALLDQPEPEGPTDEELLQVAANALGCLSTPLWNFQAVPMTANDVLAIARAAMRLPPPSLKEQAPSLKEQALDTLNLMLMFLPPGDQREQGEIIRRALEALPND